MNELRAAEERSAERLAYGAGKRTVLLWALLCDDDTTFTAVARSAAGAYRVLTAERPGLSARVTGCTDLRFR
jgi:hypothetical protein